MINFKKVGATALAGSLVAMSAYAGEMAVSGGANVTYKTGKSSVDDASSFGNDSDVGFTGTGELDNGWTFVMQATSTDDLGLSSSYTSLTMGSLGTFTIGQSSGGAGGKYDEEVPQAYEQASDAAAGTSASSNKIGDQMDNGGLLYSSPSFDMGGASISFDAEFVPTANNDGSGDGGQAVASNTVGSGYGLGLTAKYEGATFGIYGAEIEGLDGGGSKSSNHRDSFEGVVYAKYAMGPVAFGVSRSHIDSGATAAGSGKTEGYTIRTSPGIFENDQMSVAFNVNDDFSVSFTRSKDNYSGASTFTPAAAAVDVSVDQTTTAVQAAYSMGAMSIKAYNMKVKNVGYDSNALDLSVTEVALGLAF
jgi:outer membrane protein OmpU